VEIGWIGIRYRCRAGNCNWTDRARLVSIDRLGCGSCELSGKT
jgi:hypothetical protein